MRKNEEKMRDFRLCGAIRGVGWLVSTGIATVAALQP
jgi:hypothetical protein